MSTWRRLAEPVYAVSYQGCAARMPVGTLCRIPEAHEAGLADTAVLEIHPGSERDPFWWVATSALRFAEREAESRAISLANEINHRLPELGASAVGDTVALPPCSLAVAEMLASRLWVAQMLDPIAMAFGRRESTS